MLMPFFGMSPAMAAAIVGLAGFCVLIVLVALSVAQRITPKQWLWWSGSLLMAVCALMALIFTPGPVPISVRIQAYREASVYYPEIAGTLDYDASRGGDVTKAALNNVRRTAWASYVNCMARNVGPDIPSRCPPLYSFGDPTMGPSVRDNVWGSYNGHPDVSASDYADAEYEAGLSDRAAKALAADLRRDDGLTRSDVAEITRQSENGA